MIDKNDPRVEQMIRAWLIYAKTGGISTPEQNGRTPEDTDVFNFSEQYLTDTYNITLTGRGRRSLKAITSSAPAAPSGESNSYLNRVKAIINKKLSPSQKRQLKRELARG